LIELQLLDSGQLNKNLPLNKSKPYLFENLKNCKSNKILLKTLEHHCALMDFQDNDPGLSGNKEFASFFSILNGE